MSVTINSKGTSVSSFAVGKNRLVLDASNLTTTRSWIFPNSNGASGQVLSTDGSGNLSWIATGGTGTVTSIAASGSQGVSISGSPITTSGTITIGLGAITPTSVSASGTVTGSNLSGTNTGDQTITLTGDVTGSGTSSFATTLATVNGSPQTDQFRKITVNGKGLVTATSAVSSGDITTSLGYTPVNKAGDTMTGYLILNGDPVTGLGAVTKQYVDNIASGLTIHAAVVAATTATLASTYNNGASGVGATLTGTSGALPAIDGVTLSVNDRVLVKNQSNNTRNGVYVVTQTTANWILTRATDFDGSPTSEIQAGDAVFVQQGTTQANTQWVQTTTGTITVGTSAIVFTQFGGPGTYTAGTGIGIAGNVISNTGVLSNVAGTGISVSGATGNVTIGNTGVTSIAGTAGNITASASTGAVTLNLATAGSAVSNQFVKITTDSFGRVTATSAVVAGDITPLVNSTYVLKAGDTMTGALTISTGGLLVGGTSDGFSTSVSGSVTTANMGSTSGSTNTLQLDYARSSNLLTISSGAFNAQTSKITLSNTGNLSILATTASTTTTNGALIVAGGAGIAGQVNAGVLASDPDDATLPGHTWRNDTDTGMFHPGANNVAFTTNGTEVLRFNSVGAFGIGGANFGTAGQVIISAGSGTAPSWSSTPTLTGTNFTGIPNSALTNSSVTIGSTNIALGATSTTLAGLTSVTSTSFVGALTGNASTATTATTATNIAGGTANQIPYQTGVGTTSFFSSANYGVHTYGATGVPASIAGAAGVLQGSASAIPAFTTTPTLTGTNFTGIPNGALTNNSITIGTTNIALGGTSTTLAGLTSTSSTLFIGSLGSVTAPSYSFSGDSNTGIYSSGADTLNFTTGGTSAASLSSAGKLTVTGGGSFNGATQGTLGVFLGTGSGATVNTTADDFVIDGSAAAGLSILTPATTTGSIYFGSTVSAIQGGITYNHSTDTMTFRTSAATAFTLTDLLNTSTSPLYINPGSITNAVSSAVGSTVRITPGTFTDSSTAASGTLAVRTAANIAVPTFAASNTSVTYTNASSVYIAGAAAAGTNVTLTNAHALHIAAGRTFMAAGSAGTPALAIRDVNTGLYSSAASTLNVTTGGTLAATFSSAGDFTAVGDVVAYSDSRLKTNIKLIPDALLKTLKLRGVVFDRIDTGSHGTGMIAQEVEEVFPEVVKEMTDGTKTVAYGNVVGLLIESIKELNTKIDSLKLEVAALRT
jgi:hypothetical protein